jgi:hypothetical protein
MLCYLCFGQFSMFLNTGKQLLPSAQLNIRKPEEISDCIYEQKSICYFKCSYILKCRFEART